MYVKIFASILDSSVWDESPETRLVWITMLLMADEHGFVRGTPHSIARRAVVSPDGAARALAVLEAPDLRSHTIEHDGRRIESVDGGWLVLNYAKYREMRTRKQVKEAEKKRRQRARVASDEGTSPVRPPLSPPNASASASASDSGVYAIAAARESDPAGFAECWAEYPKRAGGNSRSMAAKAYRARIIAGATAAELMAGTKRYAAFIRATGKEGTEYVKQAATFYGPGDHYLEPWTLPDADESPAQASVRRALAAGGAR